MLNKNNERELAYVVKVNDILPMDAERLECACINGWKCVVGKGEFKKGDLAIYFEIDSKLPDVEPFHSMTFLASKDFKVKTQKIRKVISQGLLMSFNTFDGGECFVDTEGVMNGKIGDKLYREGDFLTHDLGVTYSDPIDNIRKSTLSDKYKLAAKCHPALAKTKLWKVIYRTTLGKKILYAIFGGKKTRQFDYPSWVKKTDEERLQSIPWILNRKGKWILTEKIDGTSTTFTMKKKRTLFDKKYDFYICSRNVVISKNGERLGKCYYDDDVYSEMAKKYHVEEFLKDFLFNEFPEAEWVTLQGETFGNGVQKRNYSLEGIDFRAFNLIDSRCGRWNSLDAKYECEADEYSIPWVPIIDENFDLPDTVDEFLEMADGNSIIDNLPREGFVVRDESGKTSFKVVSNQYLMSKKFH